MPKTHKKTQKNDAGEQLVRKLNTKFHKIHQKYEKLFWTSYMGDHSVDKAFEAAQNAREGFRTDTSLAESVSELIPYTTGKTSEKLELWKLFFSKYQTPVVAQSIFSKIVRLEKSLLKKQTSRKEGYIHPKSKKFIKASRAQMRDIMFTHDDERYRKACFESLEKLAVQSVDDFVKLIKLRNDYAHALGYEDFYAYKVMTEEGMTKQELFEIFDAIYEKTKYAFKSLRAMEKKQPGLRKPWNRGYMLAGDFTKESDQYYPFEEALDRWGRSFAALGIDFAGGSLQLDLLDREGKYENGFCHWPTLVHYKNNVRQPGSSNFTCNVVYGQVSSAEEGYNTLFHEGGHAAHLLNSTETETCVNNEYPPASTAWAETQSMFLDSMLSSIEWAVRYAKNTGGDSYPFDLFKRELDKLHALSPLGMNGISSVMAMEKALYEEKNLTAAKIKKIARAVHKKYTDSSVESCALLGVPHIYSWESSCSYQGYGLAQLAVSQWREYFYKKYDYIVDNKRVGAELKKMWKYGSRLSFPECVKKATGKKLSPASYIKARTASKAAVLNRAKSKIERLRTVRKYTKDVDLNASIKMVHGKKTIATNKNGFNQMTKKYAVWLNTKRINSVE